VNVVLALDIKTHLQVSQNQHLSRNPRANSLDFSSPSTTEHFGLTGGLAKYAFLKVHLIKIFGYNLRIATNALYDIEFGRPSRARRRQ
jgi:hypothetical protein